MEVDGKETESIVVLRDGNTTNTASDVGTLDNAKEESATSA